MIKTLIKICKFIIELLENPFIASLVTAIILIFAYFINRFFWGLIFTTLLSYLLADIIKIGIITGGNGVVQIPLISNRTQHHDHGFLAFLILVVIGTLLSGYLSDLAINQLPASLGILFYIIASTIIVGLIYLDYYLSFLKRD